MSTIAKLAVCGLLIVALAVPAFADGVPHKKASSVLGKMHQAGTTALVQTEGLVSGCLKNTFCLFNPCLDFVKGCTNIVLAPIEKPFDYLEAKLSKPKQAKKASKVSEPKKQETPK
jgi:hypothetical protein